MIPENTNLSEDFSKSRGQLIDDYRNIAEHINGVIEETTPTVNNTTVTTIDFVYYRQNILVDAWINLTWSARTGNVEIELPYYTKAMTNSVWYFPVSFSNVTLSDGYTDIVIGIPANSNTATLYEAGSGQALQALSSASGAITGHFRFLGQEGR